MNIHEKYIKRTIEISKNGLGTTRPNPMVGAVIVHNNKIIAEGFTSPYGGSHAEVNAINSIKDKSILKECTMYVTLEPCSHYGKTPPCCDLINYHNIPKVVIGCIDDNPEVAGNGVKKLKANGCEVIVGVLEEECKTHLKRFFTFHNKKRPYIILKWAETEDRFIAPETKKTTSPVWISNTYSQQLVHKWRSDEQAILVGTNTVLEDNPTLNIRHYSGNNPLRLVIDLNSKLDSELNIFNTEAESIRITKDIINTNKGLAQALCDFMFEKHINSVIIEGGTKTISTFVEENLWDEARVFKTPTIFNNGVKAPSLKNEKLYTISQIKNDSLFTYHNSNN